MSRRQTILLASRNPGKVREIGAELAGLPVEVTSLADYPHVDEPAETGATFAANACAKAMYYARATGRWCLADDSGLEVDALGGAPGVLSARYAADRCPPDADRPGIDRANNARLLEELKPVQPERRTARFVCHLALADGERILIETFDSVEGLIVDAPRGENGFGYDPLFLIPSLGLTAAELSSRQKNELSHRGKATRHMAHLLGAFLSDRGAGRK